MKATEIIVFFTRQNLRIKFIVTVANDRSLSASRPCIALFTLVCRPFQITT